MFARVLKGIMDFMKWCEEASKGWFKKVGLGHWSDNGKLACFALVVIGIPTVVFTYYMCYLVFWLCSLAKKKQRRARGNHQNRRVKVK